MSRYVNFASKIHSAGQSDIGEQQWVTGFHCVWSVVGWLIVYQDGNYLYPGQSFDRRSDDTAFEAGTFSWQDLVHSWKAGPGLNGKFIYLLPFLSYPGIIVIQFNYFLWRWCIPKLPMRQFNSNLFKYESCWDQLSSRLFKINLIFEGICFKLGCLSRRNRGTSNSYILIWMPNLKLKS